MWTCPKCAAGVDGSEEVCPHCGFVSFQPSAAEQTTAERTDATGPDRSFEAETEYDLHGFPDLGPAVVECYISVTAREAADVADRLRAQGIPARTDSIKAEGADPIHRVRVPIVDLGRALALIDLMHKRRTSRS